MDFNDKMTLNDMVICCTVTVARWHWMINFLLFPVVKEFWKSAEIWRSYRHEFSGTFFTETWCSKYGEFIQHKTKLTSQKVKVYMLKLLSQNSLKLCYDLINATIRRCTSPISRHNVRPTLQSQDCTPGCDLWPWPLTFWLVSFVLCCITAKNDRQRLLTVAHQACCPLPHHWLLALISKQNH